MAPRRVADTYGGYRARLVEVLREKGISDMAVLGAVGQVPRHLFVPEAFRNQAYDDTSLPIGNGQTISQPSTHARNLQALGLTGGERVLEIGTGSGYQTALLSFLAEHVMSVERVAVLARDATTALDRAGCTNVAVAIGDGSHGWLPMGPYDAIVVAAAAPAVPAPLVRQLRDGGRLVIPLARGKGQVLVRVTSKDGQTDHEELGAAQFVPLRGRHGFNESGTT